MTNADAATLSATPRLHRNPLGRLERRALPGLAAGALFEPHRPLMVNLVVTRRCNLSCTNGLPLTADTSRALGKAGLFGMQVSVDAVAPDDVTHEALRPLSPGKNLPVLG
ncbi:MAG TPA: hypothetical protein VKZ18_28950 [Polyangia bacterium]|nr:hypothetical protein [Polyangia bacterium]